MYEKTRGNLNIRELKKFCANDAIFLEIFYSKINIFLCLDDAFCL